MSKKESKKQRQEYVTLALVTQYRKRLFVANSVPCITIEFRNRTETLPIRSENFKDWLTLIYYESEEGTEDDIPADNVINGIIRVLSAIATYGEK